MGTYCGERLRNRLTEPCKLDSRPSLRFPAASPSRSLSLSVALALTLLSLSIRSMLLLPEQIVIHP